MSSVWQQAGDEGLPSTGRTQPAALKTQCVEDWIARQKKKNPWCSDQRRRPVVKPPCRVHGLCNTLENDDMKLKVIVAALAASVLIGQAQAANIVQTAAATGKFDTLLAAAKAAGLVGALSRGGPITVFAPTDAAFSRLPAGTVEELLKPKNKHKLAALLKYHVVPGRILAKDVPHRPIRVKTLKRGGDTTIRAVRVGKRVHIDNARVISADIRASNGIIHVVNRVLLPSS
jgi:uncharacterized surface protein with fasciclin (FAS1) repeats